MFKTLSAIIVASGLICAAMNLSADEPAPPPDAAAVPAPAPAPDASLPAIQGQPSADGKDKGKNCIWTCLRWDKQCNVDTRGVYKCNRVCADFGQQCE